MTDLIIAIVFVAIATIVLLTNEEKIAKWQKKPLRSNRKGAEMGQRPLVAQAGEITFIAGR